MKKFLAAAAVMALMISVKVFAAEPVFNYESGVYSNDIEVTISGGENIYYTTDGSIPTSDSQKYNAPIHISAKTKLLEQNMGFWQRESLSVPAGWVIRAAVIDNGVVSKVVSKTYFVGDRVIEKLGNIPIMNLIVTPYDLWDSQNGIYTNYEYEHKVDAELHGIDIEGKSAFELSGIQTKVSGHGSRSAAKKSFRIYTAKKKPLEYDLIPHADKNYKDKSKVTVFSKFNFRITDWQNTNLRDVLAQKIGAYTRADTAESTPAALFLNGEYWGLYECREQYDNKYFASHYDIDHDNVVFFDRDWTLAPQYDVLPDTGTVYVDKIDYSEGPDDGEAVLGESYYRNHWRYVRSLAEEYDITDPKVYSEFCANVDIDNFIDYLIVYIYSANDDWPGNNFKFWRVTEESVDDTVYGADGKWRFVIHDFDIAFEDVNHKTLEASALYKDADTEARHPEFATRLLKNLLKNEEFRNEFAQRTLVYASTYMSEDSVKLITDKLREERYKGKYADLMRWNLGTFNNRLNWWKNGIENLNVFARGRKNALKTQYTSILNNNYAAQIMGSAKAEVKSENVEFELGGVMLDKSQYSIDLFAGIPIEVKAEGGYVTVSDKNGVNTYYGKAVFTPEKDENYSIYIKPAENYIDIENNSVTFVSNTNAVGILAYMSDGGIIEKVTTYELDNTAVTVKPDEYNMTVKAMLWNKNGEPLCDSAVFERIAESAEVARIAGFANMTVGDKLPVVVFDNEGNRVEFTADTAGACAEYADGMVSAVAEGSGKLLVTAGGKTVEIDVTITQ